MGLADMAGGLLEPPRIGTIPGWALRFASPDGATILELDERDYRAEIDCTLVSGLDPGATTIRLAGIIESHARTLAQAMAKGPLDVDLSLGWLNRPHDRMPRVAALRVKLADRRADGLRHVAIIEAEERAFAQLNRRRVRQSIHASTALEAAALLLEAQVDGPAVRRHPPPSPPPTGEPPPKEESERGALVVDTLRRLAERHEERSNRFGRGAILIRDGVLHLGTGRPIPFGDGSSPGKPVEVGLSGMLLEVRAGDPAVVDPNLDLAAEKAFDALPSRRRFVLLLLGAPSLRPGDAVTFSPPDEPAAGAGLLGNLATAATAFVEMPTDLMTPKVTLYIETVAHRLSAATGFVSTVTGVVIDGKGAEGDRWDRHTPISAPKAPKTGPGADGTPAGRLAEALRRVAERDDGKRAPEVAEIRAHAMPGEDQPALTSTVLDGLAPAADGISSGAVRRLDLDRKNPHLREQVPYLSPFAWGPYGLVLPRLPGMRVLLAYRGGTPTDPVDLGSLRRDRDEVPADAQSGDWWLILPATGPSGAATGVADPVPTVRGPASDDLTDNAGNRVIEVGSLTVRVGPSALDEAGKRPKIGDSTGVTIEHVGSTSKIVMAADGSVTIKAGAKLTIEAATIEVKLGSGGKLDVTGGTP